MGDMRKLGCCAVAMGLTLALGACGKSGGAGSTGGDIAIAQTSQPDFLDPALSYTVNGWEPQWLVYTPPVTYRHEEGEAGTQLIPGVAEAMPKVSSDGKTYSFTLRKGLKYSDGKPVKASDWEHTIKRVLNLESGGSFFFEGIEGAGDYVDAGKSGGDISGIETDDETGKVTIKLEKADGQFMNVLAMNFSGIVPSDTPFKNLSKSPPPGVGPYKFTKSVPNREFVMEKVKGFDIPEIPKGKVDKITTKIVKSVNRQTDQVIKGDLDYMQDPPLPDRLPEVRSEYSERYKEYTTVSTYYFFFNTRVPPFDKQEVREAVNYAIDSSALTRLFGGRLTPECNFLASSLPGYEKTEPCPFGPAEGPGDVDRARALIKEAGEEGTAVEVYTNGDENRPEIGQYYADLLNKIGLRAELKTLDGGIYFQTVGNAKTKAATGFANWFEDFPHAGNFLFLVDGAAIQPTNNQNFGNVDDPELNRLIDIVQAGAADDEEVKRAAAEADKLLIEKSYVAPYGSEKRSIFLSERMDFENCKSFHPVYNTDYSALCVEE